MYIGRGVYVGCACRHMQVCIGHFQSLASVRYDGYACRLMKVCIGPGVACKSTICRVCMPPHAATSGFFHESTPWGGPFRIFQKFAEIFAAQCGNWHWWQICRRCRWYRCQIAAGVNDAVDKFAAVIVDTGGKFATRINNTSKTGCKICRRCLDKGGKFAIGVADTGGEPAWTSEYLRELSKKFETVLMGILWGWRETDSWKKNQKQKILWHCPFKKEENKVASKLWKMVIGADSCGNNLKAAKRSVVFFTLYYSMVSCLSHVRIYLANWQGGGGGG